MTKSIVNANVLRSRIMRPREESNSLNYAIMIHQKNSHLKTWQSMICTVHWAPTRSSKIQDCAQS